MNRIGILLAAFVANLVLIAGFGAITGLPAGGPTVIDLQLSMSPGVFTQIVDLWGPARVAGVASKKGAIMPGMDADIVVLDVAFDVVATLCRGEVAFDRRAATAS